MTYQEFKKEYENRCNDLYDFLCNELGKTFVGDVILYDFDSLADDVMAAASEALGDEED